MARAKLASAGSDRGYACPLLERRKARGAHLLAFGKQLGFAEATRLLRCFNDISASWRNARRSPNVSLL
jgi:hypothetical protein